MRAIPQTQIFGGHLVYYLETFNAVNQALVNFYKNNKDPKVQLMAVYSFTPLQNFILLSICYDAPIAPEGIFDEFLNIPHFGMLYTQSYFSLVNQTRGPDVYNRR